MSDHEEHPPERMELILPILNKAFTPEGKFTIHPPESVLRDFSILNSAEVLQQLSGTEWQLRFPDGELQRLYFDDLMVLVYNIQKLSEARARAKRDLKEKGLKQGNFSFSASGNLSDIMQLGSVQNILRSIQLELGPSRDSEAPEPAIREKFKTKRMEKCQAVYQRIHNNAAKRGFFDCRVVADEPVEGKTLEELGKNYFAIGVGSDLTRLPFMDSLIVFEMLKQYRAYTLTAAKPRGNFSINFQIKTEFTESEVFRLLDDLRRAGIVIKTEPVGKA